MNVSEMLKSAASDRDALVRAVGDAEIVPLILCLAQLTGDRQLLDDAKPYVTGAWHYTQTVPKTLQKKVRADLIRVIEDLAASGGTGAGLPEGAFFDTMLTVATGDKLGAEYYGVFKDETNFGEGDAREVHWRNGMPEQAGDYPVVVMGTGFSGVLAGIKLKNAGIPFVIIEKNKDVGGTWLENIYPGIGVDTPCHFYSYAFEPNSEWSSYFTEGQEILDYIRACARKYDILSHVRFGEEVTEAEWNDPSANWTIRTLREDGTTDTLSAKVLISCVGALNRPKIPNLPGKDTFGGAAFHTAQWDSSVDLKGKNVVMIGTGASGIQVGPSIAPDVAHLTIIQRSPHWVIKHPLYHETVPSSVRWAMKHIPYYSNWFRFRLYYAASDGFHSTLQMDPDWVHGDISLNAANHQMREDLIRHIKTELKSRPDLIDKCIPDYPPFGKRMLRDNNWLTTLKRENVDLIASGVDRIEPGHVVADGKIIPADVIIYATGFHAERMIWPIEVRGRNGVSLRDVWGDDDPRAHLGITLPEFPNFFMCYGPNTNLAHGGSAVFHSECQVRYIMLAIRELIEQSADVIEVEREPFENYNDRVDEKMKTMVWSHGGVTSWYKNKNGRVIMNSPWRLVDYRNMTAELDLNDYVVEKRAAAPRRAVSE